MKTNLLLTATLILAPLASVAASRNNDQLNDASAAFARLKTLVGEWEADTDRGKVHTSFELIAGGSALVERDAIGVMPPMMTVYSVDGDRLLLTHYCMMGNQPRMTARGLDPASGEIAFDFLDAANLPTPASGHMHNIVITPPDHGRFTSLWSFYENGKPKMNVTFQYTRIR